MFAAWLPVWLLVTDAIIRCVLLIHVIYRRRPVPVTLSWLTVLFVVPVFSVAAYLLVGDNRLGFKRLNRYEAITKGIEQQALTLWKSRHPDAASAKSDFGHIAGFGEAVSGFPALGGNRLTLLGDNAAVLQTLIADIDAAQDHVHMLYYIWTEDHGACAVSDALRRAARRGVACRALVDGVGSWKFIGSPTWKGLQAAGVQMAEALPVNLLRRPLARVDLRNHRKIAVIDGKIGYCGSQNINDLTFRSHRWRHTGPWIDATVRVEGPAAQALAVTFLRDWYLESDGTGELEKLDRYFPELTRPDDADSVVQVIPSGPGPTPQAIHQALLTTIYTAREELIMTTPYFVPDEALLAALIAAASRGVRVSIVMPRISDSPLVAAASRAYYLDLLDAGVRLFHFKGGLLHAKTLTMDRRMALIGSANMDARSFFLNLEATLLVYDTDFASTVRFLQTGYMSHSSEVDVHRWRRRPWWITMRDNTAQLLGPLL